MQHGAVAELLACTPMLSGLGSELLAAIILRGDTVRFRAGEPVTLAGTPADSTLYILEGKVALPEQISEESTQSLMPGSALTEMAMFIETDHYHNTIALDDVVALQISRELMGHLVFERPVLAECFATNIKNNLASIARSLNEMNAMLDNSAISEFDAESENASAEDSVAGDEEFENAPAPAVLAEDANVISDIQIDELSLDGFADIGTAEPLHEGSPFEAVSIEVSEALPVRDIMAELSAFSVPSDQTPPEQGHGQTAFPSLSPRQSHEEKEMTFSEQASPIYGLAGGPGSIDASLATDNSTR